MPLQYTMLECREASAGLRLPIQVDVGHDAALPARQALQDRAPVVDDHAVAIGFAAVRVEAGLRRRDRKSLLRDRAGAQQRLPMRAARGTGEGRGHAENLRASRAELAK